MNQFLSVADAVEDAFPRCVVDGNNDLVIGATDGARSGAFEVVICDAVGGEEALRGARAKDAVFSALREGRPPSALEILEAIESNVDANSLGLNADAGSGCGQLSRPGKCVSEPSERETFE